MEYHCCVLVKRTERSAGLLAGCDVGVLARIHSGIIAKFSFIVLEPVYDLYTCTSAGIKVVIHRCLLKTVFFGNDTKKIVSERYKP